MPDREAFSSLANVGIAGNACLKRTTSALNETDAAGRRPASVHDASAVLQGCVGAAAVAAFRGTGMSGYIKPMVGRCVHVETDGELYRIYFGAGLGLPAYGGLGRKAVASFVGRRRVRKEIPHHRVRHAPAWQVETAGEEYRLLYLICSPANKMFPAPRKTRCGRPPRSTAPASPSRSNSVIFR
jgi:hypothetical protein